MVTLLSKNQAVSAGAIPDVGFDHRHDADFFIDRPDGSGDNLLLILKTDAIFTLNGNEVFVPKNSFFLYPKGMPQFYRCMKGQSFANDWMHFLLDESEQECFAAKGIPYAEPVSLPHTEFYSYCIRAIADENSAARLHSAESIRCYFGLICNNADGRLNAADLTLLKRMLLR